jgi:uncharacterized low-complexity protein
MRKSNVTALALAAAAVVTMTGAVQAANLFQMDEVSSHGQLAAKDSHDVDSKCGKGSCGAAQPGEKKEDAHKCGAAKCGTDKKECKHKKDCKHKCGSDKKHKGMDEPEQKDAQLNSTETQSEGDLNLAVPLSAPLGSPSAAPQKGAGMMHSEDNVKTEIED